jgi:hypothetical protein
MRDASTCVCGHSVEVHGHDDEHPGSTTCTECEDEDECIAFEAADLEEEEEEED